MVAHHEVTSTRPCAAWPPNPMIQVSQSVRRSGGRPLGRAEGKKPEWTSIPHRHFWAGRRTDRHRDAAARARQTERQYLGASRLGHQPASAPAVRVRQAPMDHGRDTPGGCCASSSAATSWRTAWSRGCGTQVSTCAPARPTASSSVSPWRTAACRVTSTACIVGGPEAFAIPRSGRCKCLGQRSWRELEKRPRRVQAGLRRASGDLPGLPATARHPALFTALNADTMDIYPN